MIRRSLRWKPLGAYSFFAAVFSGWVAVGVVGVFFVRNPATAVWALVATPLYFLAFFIISGTAAVGFVAIRMPLLRVTERSRQLVLAPLAVAAGIAVAFVFWWCIEFEPPPAWAVGAGAVFTAVGFAWYARCYKSASQVKTVKIGGLPEFWE